MFPVHVSYHLADFFAGPSTFPLLTVAEILFSFLSGLIFSVDCFLPDLHSFWIAIKVLLFSHTALSASTFN